MSCTAPDSTRSQGRGDGRLDWSSRVLQSYLAEEVSTELLSDRPLALVLQLEFERWE